MENVTKHHPKFLDKWAEEYVVRYLEEGPSKAKDWAVRTLGGEEITLIRPIIKEKFRERGFD